MSIASVGERGGQRSIDHVGGSDSHPRGSDVVDKRAKQFQLWPIVLRPGGYLERSSAL